MTATLITKYGERVEVQEPYDLLVEARFSGIHPSNVHEMAKWHEEWYAATELVTGGSIADMGEAVFHVTLLDGRKTTLFFYSVKRIENGVAESTEVLETTGASA